MSDLNITAPWNPLGYGVAASNIIKALHRQGLDISYWPISGVDIDNEEDLKLAKKLVNNQCSYSPTAPSIRIWHQHDLAQHVGSPRIGFPIFELDNFNDIEIHQLISVDHVFVCSHWAMDIVHRLFNSLSIEKPISVVPLGVNTDIFKYDVEASTGYDGEHTCVFLNVGKWEVRKGHDILYEAFNEAFNENDDVELWMLTNNPFLKDTEAQQWVNLYKNTKLGKKIKILPRAPRHEDVAKIMNKADVGVFPSRAEGWNLELLEMMACGKHVIATDYSAHTEFCNKDNCDLIHIDETEEAFDGKWFNGNGNWAEFGSRQMGQLVSYMRQVYEFKKADALEPNFDGMETARQFSWDNSAVAICEALEIGAVNSVGRVSV